MSDGKKETYTRWTFTLSDEHTEWLKEQQERGYNLSALMRKILNLFLEQEKKKADDMHF